MSQENTTFQQSAMVFAGFCGRNNGAIAHSYSNVDIFTRGVNAGFTAENNAYLTHCLSLGDVKKLGKKEVGRYGKVFGQLGFCNQIAEVYNRCFFISKKARGYYDYELNIKKGDFFELVRNNPQEWSEKIWELRRGKIGFRDDLSQEMLLPDDVTVVEISSARHLFSIAKAINEGDEAAAAAHYKLTTNIDLKGKKWLPLGTCDNPFTGTFNGENHKIFNFKILDMNYGGFFGYVKDAMIANLTVECIVKGNKSCAGFVGYNNGGKIACCHSCATVSSKNVAAGFVAVNNGLILKCSAKGKVSYLASRWVENALIGVFIIAFLALFALSAPRFII